MPPALQVFYDEFGALMMRQPLFGLGFTTYAPLALLPYMAGPLLGIACAWSQNRAVLRHRAVGHGGVSVLALLRSSAMGDIMLVCRAQALLLWVGVFNRLAGVFVRGGAVVWEDDYETRSPAAAQVQPWQSCRLLVCCPCVGWWLRAMPQSIHGCVISWPT